MSKADKIDKIDKIDKVDKKETFASVFSRIPQTKLKDAMCKITPSLVELSKTLHSIDSTDDDWLDDVKDSYTDMTPDDRFNKLLE